jgi:hypothetical protein
MWFMLLVFKTARHETSRTEHHNYNVIVYVYFINSLDQRTVFFNIIDRSKERFIGNYLSLRSNFYLTNMKKHTNIRVKKAKFMHNLSSAYFVNHPLHVSGVFTVHHQEVHRIYTTVGIYCSF